MLMPRPDFHPYYHQQGVDAVTLRGDRMSADGAQLVAYSRGLHNSGEELNDEGLSAIRLVFSQCG